MNKETTSDRSWNKIFKDYKLFNYDFEKKPYLITAKDIKAAC